MKKPWIWIAMVLGSLMLAGCEGRGGGGGGTPGCPYSGGPSCEDAAERSNGEGGLCADIDTVSVYQLTQDCEGWSDSAFRDCWTACVESAGSCDEAQDCQTDCYYCN